MTLKGQIIVVVIAAMLLFAILNMLRRRRLNEEVSLIWIGTLAGVIVLMAVPGLLAWLTRMVGAEYPASALTLCALGFVGAMLVYVSVKLSTLSSDIRSLAQNQALVELELARRKDRDGPG